MSELGFQPVCVMYQGNDSPLDGTYRLVCRHQIREEAFLPDDFVHVEDLTPGSSGELKQGVVMGEDLVTMLLRSLYPTAAAQTSSTTPMKRKRGAPSDEESDCLREVLSTVRDIKNEVLRQSHELSHIKRRQIQLETKMSLMQESIIRQVPVSKQQWTKPRGKNITAIKGHNRSVVDRDILPIISNMVEVMTEDGEDDKSTPKKKGVPQENTYIDNSEGYLAELLSNAESPFELVLGNEKYSIKVTQEEMEEMMYTTNPKSFAYRLTTKCFTRAEMMEGNTKGVGKQLNGEPYKKLDPTIVHMIKDEVKKRYPIAKGEERLLMRIINQAVNERTRNERKNAFKRVQRQERLQKQEQEDGDSSS